MQMKEMGPTGEGRRVHSARIGSTNGSHWFSQEYNYEAKKTRQTNNGRETLETLRQSRFSLHNPVWCNVQVIHSFMIGTYKMSIRWIMKMFKICIVNILNKQLIDMPNIVW